MVDNRTDQKVSQGIEDNIHIKGLDKPINQASYYASLASNIIWLNGELEKLTGYTAEELIGQPTSSLFTNKEQAASLEEGTLKAGETKTDNVILLTKDKKEVPVTVSTSLLKDNELNATGYVAMFIQVIENRQMQQRIEQAAREWRATLDAITDMVWICDKDCRLLRVNQAYANLVGLEPKLVVGKTCSTVFSWAEVVCTDCPHKHTIATKESALKEFYKPEQDACLEV
ncbi:MAG: PAS domain-containing protein, partial [Chloroflexota bacterium]